jgi:LysM repeat protein
MFRILFIVALVNVLSANHVLANKKLIEQYVTQYKDLAIQEMRTTGIPASIKLAQGLLESDWGRSDLANKANNHFGMKCGKDWPGDTFMKYDDDSDENGMLIESCFRVYSHPAESYKAHSEFLLNPAKKSRYGFLFDYPSTDYVSWANGLKFAGYATDPKYPEKLIKIIESNQLYKFDEPVFITPKQELAVSGSIQPEAGPKSEKQHSQKENHSGTAKTIKMSGQPEVITTSYKKSDYRIQKINDVRVLKARGNETLESLARAIDMDVYDLMEYNELFDSKDILLPEGSHVYLQKKKRVNNESEFHKVNEGENMFYIAQQYGLRLESLYARNNMEQDTEPLPGERISLKKHLPKKDTPRHRQVIRQENVFLNMGKLK